MLRSANAFFLWFHRWSGIAFAAVFILVALSGTVLTFRYELQQAMHPEMQVEPADVDRAPDFTAIAANLKSEIPGARLNFLQQNPAQPEFPIRVVYEHPLDGFDVLYADPHSARLIRSDVGEGFWRWMRELHIFLTAGMPGLFIVFASAWVLMLCSALGLWLWVPRLARKPQVALGIRWRSGTRKLLLDLHNTTGVYLLLPMMLLGLTGATLILARLSPVDLPEPTAPAPAGFSAGTLGEPLEKALATLAAEAPAAFVRQIRLPSADLPSFRFDYDTADGARIAFLSADGEKLLAVHAESSRSLWDQLKGEFGVAIHEGYVAGDFGRWIVFICGITLTTGSVTGVWLWLVARRRRRLRREPLPLPDTHHHQPAE